MLKEHKTVFVGISGGVDSSVSALLLKKQGYRVVGVFIRTWTPDFIECTWKKERRDAMRICAQLEIPFLECDAEEAYKKKVADYMIEEYKKGRTPNPDVMCNREIKFGIFWHFAKNKGADFIATGHYAKNNYELSIKSYQFKKGKDESKDQSYFLWTLNQEDLSHILFPVGNLKKEEVRKIAQKNNLYTSDKKDSQGICFLGPIDIKEFLKHYIKIEKGDVLNESGEVIGYHEGSIFFTIGERHGFTITKKTNEDKPYYIVAKDIISNTITVSPRLGLGETSTDLMHIKDRFNIINTNWISVIFEEKEYTAQIRYHGELFKCEIKIKGKETAEIIFQKAILIAPGQSIVFYQDDVCVGGGIIE